MVHKVTGYINRLRQPHVLPILYAAFLSLGALVTLFSVLQSKSESQNAFLLGYSLEMILLGSAILFLLLLFLALTWQLIRHPKWTRRLWDITFNNPKVNAALLWTALAVFLSCWIILFMPFLSPW
ncbi:MAG: hypothetical protein IPO22_19185 [Anaerolineales bacterium]|nr:hypothetical protein [Anaerolineales bacterium]